MPGHSRFSSAVAAPHKRSRFQAKPKPKPRRRVVLSDGEDASDSFGEEPPVTRRQPDRASRARVRRTPPTRKRKRLVRGTTRRAQNYAESELSASEEDDEDEEDEDEDEDEEEDEDDDCIVLDDDDVSPPRKRRKTSRPPAKPLPQPMDEAQEVARKRLLFASMCKLFPDRAGWCAALAGITGQEEAVGALAEALALVPARIAISPVSTLCLAGGSGVGKTTALEGVLRTLGVHGTPSHVHDDGTQYMDDGAVNNISGAGDGFTNCDSQLVLMRRLARADAHARERAGIAVLTFDEVDKAHPKVLTALMDLASSGRYGGRGEGGTFEALLIVFVSNWGAVQFAAAARAEDEAAAAGEEATPLTLDRMVEMAREDMRIPRDPKHPVLQGFHIARLGKVVPFRCMDKRRAAAGVVHQLRVAADAMAVVTGIRVVCECPDMRAWVEAAVNYDYGFRDAVDRVKNLVAVVVTSASRRGVAVGANVVVRAAPDAGVLPTHGRGRGACCQSGLDGWAVCVEG